MKFTKTAKLFISLALAVIMIASLMVPAMAYQSAFKNGATVTAFSQTAKDKMAAMKDGDNIFALGTFSGSAGDFANSGNCQFNFQRNDGKWGRAIKDTGWSINGMANIGDGIIDTATTGTAPAGCLIFSKKNDAAKKVNANAEEGKADSKYYTLSGWEFAANFKVKGFKIYFAQGAYADDFDILIGHLDGDSIVWEGAFSGNDMGEKFTKVQGTTNDLYSYEAEFCKTMEGRFIQIATKSYEGHSTENRTGYYSYVCPEFEVYYGEVAGVNHNIVEAPASATCTEDGLAAHYECTSCGALYSDAKGLNAISEEDIAVPALGHRYVDGECVRCSATATAIESADDFAAMAADGVYYLANDITIDTSYDKTFTGEFDGQGHTITATAPLFYTFNGTVSDLTVDANITSERDAAGAVAEYAESITAENVTVTGSVINTVGDAGGIVGNAASAAFDGCENYAKITANLNAAGLAGKVATNTTAGKGVKCADCANYGDITSTATAKGAAAGLVGYVGAKSNSFVSTFDNCANYGDVTGASPDSAAVAGIVAYVFGTKDKSYPVLTECFNFGDITNNSTSASGFVSQMVGYCNCINTTLDKCFCLGTATAAAGKTVLIGLSSADAASYANINVYFYGEEGSNYVPEWFTWSKGTAGNCIALANASNWGEAIEVTAAELASGAVACDINTKAGKALVGQNIDKINVKASPVPLPTADQAPVYARGEGKYSNYEYDQMSYAQVAVGQDLSVYFGVSALGDESPVVTVTDAEGNDVAFAADPKETNGFVITGITPQMMSDVLYISVNGEEATEFTIRDYCLTLLEKNAANTDLCNYVKALLHYGAAAQTFANYNTENLADAGIDVASDPVLLTETSKDWTAYGDYKGAVEVTAAGMYIDYRTSLYFKTSGTGNVTYITGKSFEKMATTELDGAVGAVFAELNLAELGKVYNVTVFDGDDMVGILTYSGLSFIYSNQNRTDARGAFAKAMLNLYRATLPMVDA